VIVIDGTAGEGGGQVLRTALSLSLVTGQPFRIERIRGRREKPGLLRQHLAAVDAARWLGGASVDGARLGSDTVEFAPRRIQAEDHRIDIGSAGSTTLVAQTLIPALLRLAAPVRITIAGGTHNPLAPTVDFLAHAFVPLLRRMGARIDVALTRAGYYPAGGGEMVLTVEPGAGLEPLHVPARGALRAAECVSRVAHLARSIAERELATAAAALPLGRLERGVVEDRDSPGRGNVVVLKLVFEHVTEVFAGFGARGVRAETVAEAMCAEARVYLASGAAVGSHLADQLLLPLALAGGGDFTTLAPSGHTRTNAALIERFLPVQTRIDEAGAGVWRVEVARTESRAGTRSHASG
jgi:RNA 3'-terminal phosphate cyclase (ATP)